MRKLKNLHERDVLLYQPRKDQPQIVFTTPRFDAKQLPLSPARLAEKKQHYATKVKAVVHYMSHPVRCRTQLLLEYFDEHYPMDCGVCDHCLQKKKSKVTAPSPTEKLAARDGIVNYLKDTPTTPDILIQELGTYDQTVVVSVVKEMLDQGELYYNKQGCLTVS